MSRSGTASPLLPPVVIGALGGSGTRLVASILLESGFYLGDDLNPERDNLWFTLLFKRPRWYAGVARHRTEEIHTGLRVFERAMVAGGPLDAEGGAFLGRALFEALTGRHGQARAHTRGWPLKQALALWRAPAAARHAGERWGWKEPNSHVFLPPLVEHFPGMRFIYVVRHGLDMAFSGNRQQLRNWGPLFGVAPGSNGSGGDSGAAPRAMLDFWIRATERAVADGTRLLGDRFLLLDYDALCLRPAVRIPALLGFLGLEPSGAAIDRLVELVEIPPTIGRFRRQDLSQFEPRALEAVQALGFAVD